MTKKTSDLYFAAALLTLGAKLENVNREDPRHMEFEFSNLRSEIIGNSNSIMVLELDSWETQWANDTLMVPASSYAEAIRRMKSVVHAKS